MKAVTVLAIDDHELFRAGIKLIVRQTLPQAQFHSFSSVGEALELFGGEPDVVLLDLHLGGMDGQTAIRLVKVRWPSAAVVVVTAERDRTILRKVIDAGARDVVMKADPPERLGAALGAVLQNSRTDWAKPELSRRQEEILQLLNVGLSNKAIANEIGLSEFTVRGHVQQILKAFKTSSRAQAVHHAKELGIL